MLLDTAGLVCYFDRDSAGHATATTLYLADDAPLTHSLVLAELIALLTARRTHRARVLEIIDWLTAGDDVAMIWVDGDLQREAVAHLRARADKDYSLCDAVRFLLMSEYGLTEALTTDGHFRQAGFRALLEEYA